MYDSMTTDMGQKLSGYYQSLQSRYGDPRVYAQQQDQMARDRVAVQHATSQKTARLLEDAYQRQSERNRELHSSRISNRVDRTSSTLPESAAPKKRRTARPQTADPEPSDPVPSSATAQDPRSYPRTE